MVRALRVLLPLGRLIRRAERRSRRKDRRARRILTARGANPPSLDPRLAW